jgi:uncharacterized protein
MGKLVSFVGMTVGGAIGWYAGMPVGFMTAFILSCVGTGVGLYVARRAAQQYLVLALGFLALAAPRARAQTPATTKAAADLMQVMHVDKALHDQIAAAFDLQVKNNPSMAPMRPAMMQFFDKYLTWDAIGPQITQVYAETFTESELKQMVAFYNTPTGQKVATQLPAIEAKLQQIGLQAVQQHQGELTDMIRQQQQSPDVFRQQPPAPKDTTHH